MRANQQGCQMDWQVVVHGWCAAEERQISRWAAGGRLDRLLDVRGDFAVLVRESGRDRVVASRSGLVNYFYASGPRGAAHGTTVSGVARAARLRWEWNHAAVADYLRLGHPLGEATVHAAVHRAPPGSVTTLESGGRVAVSASAPPDGSKATAADAVEALRAAVGSMEQDCVLSLSGGLDSRVLLAALLNLGRRPAVVVSGVPGSFDLRVATAIAEAHGLRLTTTAVRAVDVTTDAHRMSGTTNGLLPLTNWAGLAHTARIGPSLTAPVMHGAIGEFARGYYAPDRGAAALLASLRPRNALAALLAGRYPPPLTREEAAMTALPLREALRPDAFRRRVLAASDPLPGAGLLDVADEFFLRHYGVHKTGAEMAALGRHARWRTPFFDPSWLAAVRALPRRLKVGDRLHRRIIADLHPRLLRFPEEGRAATTARRPGPRHWWRGPRPDRCPHYLDQSIVRGPEVAKLLQRSAAHLVPLADEDLLPRLLDGEGPLHRPHPAFALLALALLREYDIEQAGERSTTDPQIYVPHIW